MSTQRVQMSSWVLVLAMGILGACGPVEEGASAPKPPAAVPPEIAQKGLIEGDLQGYTMVRSTKFMVAKDQGGVISQAGYQVGQSCSWCDALWGCCTLRDIGARYQGTVVLRNGVYYCEAPSWNWWCDAGCGISC